MPPLSASSLLGVFEPPDAGAILSTVAYRTPLRTALTIFAVTVPILRKWLAVCLGLYSQRHLGLCANDYVPQALARVSGLAPSRHMAMTAAMIAGPTNNPIRPNVSKPPKMPRRTHRKGRRVDAPIRAGRTK